MRLLIVICVATGFVIPVAAQVGMDTESLLFRSYGDNPEGAVARIKEPLAKPPADIPLPPKKPVISVTEPPEETVKEETVKEETVKEPESAAETEDASVELPEGMKPAPVPAIRPKIEPEIAEVKQEEEAPAPAEPVEEEVVEEKPVETTEAESPPPSVESVIEELIEATTAAVIPPKKPPKKPVEEQAEQPETAVEELNIAALPVPLPKPRIQPQAPAIQEKPRASFHFNDDSESRSRPSQDERSAGLRDTSRHIQGRPSLPRFDKVENLVIKTRSGIEWLFEVEMAVSEEQHRQGLMFRTSLSEESGMLFLYNPSQRVSMWMKNTKIPLDMIFIAQGGRIVKIHETARPGDTRPVSSGRPVRAVLEINAGLARELGIREGDQVIHKVLR